MLLAPTARAVCQCFWLKVQPQQTEKTETFTDLDEGSKIDIYIFKSKELDETDLLLSSQQIQDGARGYSIMCGRKSRSSMQR